MGGSGGAGGGGAGGKGGTGGTGTGGAGTGGRAGTGGVGGTGGCAAGTNRCVGGDLQTCSSTGSWQSTGTSTHQLLANPGFEAGTTNWTTSVAGGFALIYVATGMGNSSPDVAAQSPPNVAWFGGYNNADDIASQSVVIPADATSINVSFYYAIVTRENGTAANDVMDVTVTAGAQTTAVAHFSNANAVAAWTRFSAALPATLAGQTVRLQFRDLTNNNAITSFYVDTVALQVVACP